MSTPAEKLRESLSSQLRAAIKADGRSPEAIAFAAWGPQDGDFRDGYRNGKRIRAVETNMRRATWPQPEFLEQLARELGMSVEVRLVKLA